MCSPGEEPRAAEAEGVGERAWRERGLPSECESELGGFPLCLGSRAGIGAHGNMI